MYNFDMCFKKQAINVSFHAIALLKHSCCVQKVIPNTLVLVEASCSLKYGTSVLVGVGQWILVVVAREGSVGYRDLEVNDGSAECIIVRH